MAVALAQICWRPCWQSPGAMLSIIWQETGSGCLCVSSVPLLMKTSGFNHKCFTLMTLFKPTRVPETPPLNITVGIGGRPLNANDFRDKILAWFEGSNHSSCAVGYGVTCFCFERHHMCFPEEPCQPFIWEIFSSQPHPSCFNWNDFFYFAAVNLSGFQTPHLPLPGAGMS